MSASGGMALRQRLIDAPLVTALIGERIYPQVAPQQKASDVLDYVVYHEIDDMSEHHMGGASGICWMRVQFDIMATTHVRATAIKNAIRLTLDGFRGHIAVDGESEPTKICHCFRDIANEEFDPPVDGSQKGRHRITQDYRIAYEEQIPVFTGA